jgi:hypothetical protein
MKKEKRGPVFPTIFFYWPALEGPKKQPKSQVRKKQHAYISKKKFHRQQEKLETS